MPPPSPQPDTSSFHPIWYVTPDKSAARITCKVDLLAAVLGGMIAPSTQVRDDGQCYEGKLDKGVRDGHRVYTWASGARYEGLWQKGERHGHGVDLRSRVSGRTTSALATQADAAASFRVPGNPIFDFDRPVLWYRLYCAG